MTANGSQGDATKRPSWIVFRRAILVDVGSFRCRADGLGPRMKQEQALGTGA